MHSITNPKFEQKITSHGQNTLRNSGENLHVFRHCCMINCFGERNPWKNTNKEIFWVLSGFISALRGTLTRKATKILKGTYLKVGGDGSPLKKVGGGRVPPRPLGSYAPVLYPCYKVLGLSEWNLNICRNYVSGKFCSCPDGLCPHEHRLTWNRRT